MTNMLTAARRECAPRSDSVTGGDAFPHRFMPRASWTQRHGHSDALPKLEEVGHAQ